MSRVRKKERRLQGLRGQLRPCDYQVRLREGSFRQRAVQTNCGHHVPELGSVLEVACKDIELIRNSSLPPHGKMPFWKFATLTQQFSGITPSPNPFAQNFAASRVPEHGGWSIETNIITAKCGEEKLCPDYHRSRNLPQASKIHTVSRRSTHPASAPATQGSTTWSPAHTI